MQRLRSLGRLLGSALIGRTPAPWTPHSGSIPAALRTRPGLPDESFPPATPLRSYRDERPGEDAWRRGVESRVPRPAHHRVRLWLLDLRLSRLQRAAAGISRRLPRRRPTPVAADLTASVRGRGTAAGLSALAVAPYEARWQFADSREDVCGDRMIVVAVEQDSERMKQAPDRLYPLTVRRTYVRLLEGAIEAAHALLEAGYRARIYELDGGAMSIPYAISAGLGQLGMNGQLLTPQAGSRVRLLLISTDAPLVLDEPADFGIPGLCNQCGICARRCPVGAIQLRPREHRGATKWKIKTSRCLPMVAQADGCAICIKTCPIQHYGLDRVLDTYRRSGRILGSKAEELESYVWPLDGNRYSSGERPKLDPEIRRPAGLRTAQQAEEAAQ